MDSNDTSPNVIPQTAAVIVMGVSGCGKSTIGSLLAHRLSWEFQDGDWFHPPENVEKMHNGTPLTDADRMPWLNAIAARIGELRMSGAQEVIACSALKKRYRDILVGGNSDVRLVYLKGSQDLIGHRISLRQEHFMPAALLQSQFATLEEPSPAEKPIVVAIDGTPADIVSNIIAALSNATGNQRAAE